jgi:hypothetical protein
VPTKASSGNPSPVPSPRGEVDAQGRLRASSPAPHKEETGTLCLSRPGSTGGLALIRRSFLAEAEKRIKRRANIAKELVTTEENYVNNIRQFIEVECSLLAALGYAFSAHAFATGVALCYFPNLCCLELFRVF